MAETKPAKRKRPGGPSTPEGRAKLSQLAKERHARGEFGGAEFGKLGGRGNTKEKRRASQELVQHARSQTMLQKMKDALEEGLDSEQAIGTRLKTVELIHSIEKDEAKLTIQEENAEAQQMSREELIEALKMGLSKGQMKAAIGLVEEETGIIDADVVEEDDDG